MLNLSNLRSLLLQVLSLPSLHTAVLFTPEGHLVSYASDPSRPKDEVRVVVGLSGDIWQETKEHGIGMVESEVRRSFVRPYFPRFVNRILKTARTITRHLRGTTSTKGREWRRKRRANTPARFERR